MNALPADVHVILTDALSRASLNPFWAGKIGSLRDAEIDERVRRLEPRPVPLTVSDRSRKPLKNKYFISCLMMFQMFKYRPISTFEEEYIVQCA